MKKIFLAFLLAVLLLPSLSAATSTGHLVFSADFKDVQISGNSLVFTNGSTFPENNMEFGTDYPPLSSVQMDNSGPDGARCLHAWLNGIPGRFEFNLLHAENMGIGTEFYYDLVMAIRSDRNLQPWCALAQPISVFDGTHYFIVGIDQVGDTTKVHSLISETNEYVDWSQDYAIVSATIPKGQYFHLKVYVKRDVNLSNPHTGSHGIVKIWVNDALMIDAEGVQTALNGNTESFYLEPFSIYGQLSNSDLYVKSLQIYNGMPTTLPTCSDGTLYSSCSSNKPLYCSNGNLVNNCALCNCSTGTCQSDGTCKTTPTCSDGTSYGSCSATKPLYCSNGNLINGCGSPYNCNCSSGTCQSDGSCKTSGTGQSVFSTGFETATVYPSAGFGDRITYGSDPTSGIPTGINYQTAYAWCALDNTKAHTGSKSLELYCNPSAPRDGSNDRNQYYIGVYGSHTLDYWVGREFYVSVWLYLPSDFQVSPSDGFMEPGDFFAENNPPNYYPFMSWYIFPGSDSSHFNLEIGGRDLSGTLHFYKTYTNYALPRGRWFHVEWHVIRDPSNGKIQMWIDGNKIFDASGLITWGSTESFFTSPAALYGTYGYIWADDLQIYKGMPSSTCTDGTQYGSCSATKPLYCSNGNLINSCGSPYNCGCSSGTCQSDGSCSSAGPVAYWNFNEGTGSIAHDSSSYGNNGTLYNNPTWVDGKIGKALQFSGNAYLQIPNSTSLSFDKSQGTISFWIKPFNKASGAYQTLVTDTNWGNKPNGGIELALNPTGYLYFYPSQGGGNNYNAVNNPLTNNVSQFLTVTWNYSAKKVNFYVNGVKQTLAVENVPSYWTSTAITGNWQIGGTSLLSGRTFNGTIDEVKIWNRALSDAEVMAEYNGNVQQCTDGTQYGSCSATKPLYCSNGNLINACGSPYNCGCSSGTCQTDGTCKTANYTGVLNLKPGWNMFSLPVNKTVTTTVLFSGCSVEGPVYHFNSFNGSYEAAATIKPGLGYWVALGTACNVSVTGNSVGTGDLPAVQLGWNQIGSPSAAVSLSSLKGICANISTALWYNPLTANYESSSTLQPGIGYWINSGSNCKLGLGIPPLPQLCADGTVYGQCSSNKPLYCNNGNLVSNCSQCNCPFGQTCDATTGSYLCTAVQQCSDGTHYEQCSSNKPLYCNNGNLVNRCSQCGCPCGQSCQTDGSCKPLVTQCAASSIGCLVVSCLNDQDCFNCLGSGYTCDLTINRCKTAQTGLIGYWKFDEGTGTTAKDSSQYNNDAILYNNPTWVDGKIGKALQFSGNAYLQIPNSTSLSFDKSQGTISFWIKPFNKASGAYQTLVTDTNWGNKPNGGIELAINPSGILYFYPSQGGGSNYDAVTNPLTNNASQFLTVTWNYSAKKVNFYVNGVKQTLAVENVPSYWTSTAITGNWQIGGTSLLSGRTFNGTIDEVKIWNRALTQAEIQAEYNATVPQCSDGTAYGSCSTTKPLYCSNGNLINGCGSPYNCGCDFGYTCNTTSNSCKPNTQQAIQILRYFDSNGQTPSAQWVVDHSDMSQSDEGSYRFDSTELAQIHKLNPNYIALRYHNFWGVYEASLLTPTNDFEEFKSKGWLLKDTSGNYINYGVFGGDTHKWAMDIGNPDLQDFQAKYLADHMGEGWNGVFADNSMWGGVQMWGYKGTSVVNPRTGKVWTNDEVVDALVAFAKKVKNAIGNRLLVSNGIWNGETFYNWHAGYIRMLNESPCDGVMSENFLGGGTSQQNFDIAEEVGKRNKILVAVTDSNFGAGLMLLTANRNGYYFGSVIKMGTPSGPYYSSGNLLVRDFSGGGKVVVNLASQTATITASGS